MKILSETDEKVVNMEVEFTDEETEILLNYAHEHMSEEKRVELMMEWALIEILKETIEQKSDEEPETDEE